MMILDVEEVSFLSFLDTFFLLVAVGSRRASSLILVDGRPAHCGRRGSNGQTYTCVNKFETHFRWPGASYRQLEAGAPRFTQVVLLGLLAVHHHLIFQPTKASLLHRPSPHPPSNSDSSSIVRGFGCLRSSFNPFCCRIKSRR